MVDVFEKFYNPLMSGYGAATKTEIMWCIVKSVDPEKQTMKVISGESSKEIEVYINQNISILGAGIRFMPVPDQTKAIIHSKYGIDTHLGYFLENGAALTDSKTGDKQSGFLLQRYIEPGEVQLVSLGQNEVLLENTGSIFIKSGNNQYLRLDDINMLFDGNFGTFKFEMDEVRVRAGNIRRPLNDVTNEDEYITDDETTSKYYKEFTVSVGNIYDDDTKDFQLGSPAAGELQDGQFSVDQFPYAGFMSLASKVFNDQGTEEKVFNKFLKFLLKFPVGISLSVDEEGTFTVLDQTTQNFMRFKVGYNATEVDIKIKNNSIKLSNSGLNVITSLDGSKSNTVALNDTGVTIVDSNQNKIEMTSAGVKITTATALITGDGSGQVTINGEVAPTGIGPFCGIKNCIFSGVPHVGPTVAKT